MNAVSLSGHFIEPEGTVSPKQEQPASYVRRSFYVRRPVKRAALLMTALGVFRGYLNGRELEGSLLMPGYTDYMYRLQVFSWDITDRILPGENAVGAVIGDGWYRGCINFRNQRNVYGTKLALAFGIELVYEDGSRESIYSDEECFATQDGPLRENNLKTLERYDARLERRGWSEPGFDCLGWHGVTAGIYEGQLVEASPVPVTKHECFTPVILSAEEGHTVLDFGQNFTGIVRFQVTGEDGREVRLSFGESLDRNGSFTVKNLKIRGTEVIASRSGQRLEYTLREGSQTFEPVFLYCGFRYVLVENWPGEVNPADFTGIAVYSDIPYTGEFACSNPKVTKLFENIRWSQKSNFVDIPAECSIRERAGWTADAMIYAESACFLSDPKDFFLKWLSDYMLEQGEDGNLPFIVPESGKKNIQRGCLGWSNAIAGIALTLYRFYGEKEILERVYQCVVRFVDFNLRRALDRNPLYTFRLYKNRKMIVETGFHYGEWLEPGTGMVGGFLRGLFCPDTEVTSAWFYETVREAAEMAKILGKRDDAAKLSDLSEQLKETYQKNFLENGTVKSKRQCRYVRPLALGLIPEEKRKDTAQALEKLCAENRYRIGTGFLSTWQVLPVLSENGCTETAYRILENEEQPGWLFEVNKGATSVWENWYGIDENGTPRDSHNHYAQGAVAAWLFGYCAGIRPLQPGFAKALVQPMPGGSLTWAKASVETVRGKIVSDWRLEDGTFFLKVETPVRTKVVLPDGSSREVHAGTWEFSAPFTGNTGKTADE